MEDIVQAFQHSDKDMDMWPGVLEMVQGFTYCRVLLQNLSLLQVCCRSNVEQVKFVDFFSQLNCFFEI